MILFPIVWFVFICLWGTFVKEKYRGNLTYTHSGDGFLNTKLKQADTLTGVDVLIVGSSHAYRGFDTRIFKANGISAFNFGSSSQTPVQSEFLLKRYLHKIKPRLIILEVGFMTITSDGVESGIDMVSNVETFDKDLFDMMFTVNNVSVYNTFAFSFFQKKIRNNERDKIENMERPDGIFVEGGFVETKQSAYDDDAFFKNHEVPMRDLQKESLIRIIDMAVESKTHIVLVQAPVLYENYVSVTNRSAYDSLFRSYQIPYFNFNNSSYIHQYFTDIHHLNLAGVVKFNSDLLTILKPLLDGSKK
jgi:hypothetical protein